MKIKIIILISVALCLFSCKSRQQNFDDFKGKIISVGNGGGFSGAYDEYSILENGQMFHYNTLRKERLNIGKLDVNMTKQIFLNYDLLKLGEMEVNSPGNMNYLIKYSDGEMMHKSQWSDMENGEKNHILFYKFAMNYINKSKK